MHGLYLLWWVQHKQLPPAAVASVLAATDFLVMVLELPTGWFADRCGHRLSLLVGSLVQVAGMLWCWLGVGVPGLIIACALVAVGDAFRSGAAQALLYRSCLALDREEEFLRIEARAATLELIALVLLVLAGGAIATIWSFDAAWLAEAGLCAIGFGIAAAMSEPRAADPKSLETGCRSADERAPGVFSRPMAFLILPASFASACAGALVFFAQTDGAPETGQITMFVAAITVVEAAGSWFASRVSPDGVRGQLCIAGGAAVITASAACVPGLLYPAVFALCLLSGFAAPVRAAAIQRATADHERARAASIANLCDMACSAAALPAAGLLARRN
jgi:hypothetical protein